MSAQDTLERVRRTLLRHRMVAAGDTVVVGVSGGVDSVSLLDILARLQTDYDLTLVVAHVHHGLRAEEGDREFRLVEALASRYDAAFEGRRIGASEYPTGVNIQAQARRLRYGFYEQVAGKWGADRIATGHHQDDHTETLLMQILRGTGGLTGIRPVRDGRYVRPLIETPREEIRAYALRRGLPSCEDSSNRKGRYLRNRIRQELIPWIHAEVNPSFSAGLPKLASILQEEASCLHTMAEETLQRAAVRTPAEGVVSLTRDVLVGVPRAIQRRVLRQAYRILQGSTQGLSFEHIEGICEALTRPGGRVHKVFSLPRGMRVFLEYEAVHLSRSDLWEVRPYVYPLHLGEQRVVPEAGIALLATRVPFRALPSGAPRDRSRVWLDADTSLGEMIVRNVRPGDRFRPLGLGGEKKIKDFFVDEKIPRSLRARIAILEVGGRVGWVIGYRLDDRFKISDQTRTVLEVRRIPYEQAGNLKRGEWVESGDKM